MPPRRPSHRLLWLPLRVDTARILYYASSIMDTKTKTKRPATKHTAAAKTPSTKAKAKSPSEPASSTTEEKKAVAENTRKWGRDIVDAGWIYLPSTLVLKRTELGMDAVDLNIVLVLLQHWWRKDELPFPTKAKIGGLVGIDPSNVRKRLARLEAEGLITRKVRPKGGARNDSNIYSFDGLIAKAKPLAVEVSAERRDSGAKSRTAKVRRAAAAAKGASS